jgi:hypothetical protein
MIQEMKGLLLITSYPSGLIFFLVKINDLVYKEPPKINFDHEFHHKNYSCFFKDFGEIVRDAEISYYIIRER